jgi:23S rRNA (adenine2503-C2)-methyltransferase
MEIVKKIGTDKIAELYVAKIGKHMVEFAESIQPPLTRNEKWVIIISCLYGCPVKCLMCDAGQKYFGKLTKDEMFEQIDFIVDQRYPDRKVPAKKFKIQFTRMGEPAFNPAVLDALRELPTRYDAPGLLPSFSTVGPKGCDDLLMELKEIKNELYGNGMFQMQFSIHTTNPEMRDKLIPIEKMDFSEIAEFGKKFFVPGDRKITLNFIVMEEYPIDLDIIEKHFDPEIFVLKLTPLNPTGKAEENKLTSKLDPNNENSIKQLIDDARSRGFDVIVSIGDQEENVIGSNCGMYVSGEDK